MYLSLFISLLFYMNFGFLGLIHGMCYRVVEGAIITFPGVELAVVYIKA